MEELSQELGVQIKNEPALPEVLTVKEASGYLRVGVRKVRALFFLGKLAGFQNGKAVRLSRESVVAYGRGEAPLSKRRAPRRKK